MINKTIDSMLHIYLLSCELKNSYYMVKWFTNHLSRCKKRRDVVKLTVILVGHIEFCTVLISKINDVGKGIINCLCVPIDRKPQLLLNERN